MREHTLALAIEQIKERCNFSAILGRHSKLVKTAQGYKACCPLPGHSEKTPSFNLDTRKNLFYCYGCNRGGDVFKFLELVEGVPFMDAVRDLAEELNIELPKQKAGDVALEKRVRDERDGGFELLDRAAQFFHKVLIGGSTPGAQKCLDYLQSRGISDEERKELLIGWAPEEGTALAKRLKDAAERAVGEKTGLVRDYRGRAQDFFRARMMIPIRDHRGRVIAFSGRTLEPVSPENPKYKNSSETDWFKKKQVLYGLDRAQKFIREQGYVCLVEGYFDQWAFHRVGVPCVAVMGTALSEDHMRLLGRHTQQVVLVFDTDEAGMRSTKRYLEPLLQQGWDVKVFQEMAGKDPDEWLAAKGKEVGDVNRLLKAAPEALEWWARRLLQEARRDGLNRLQTLKALQPVWALARNPLHKGVLADEIARQLGLQSNEVRRDLDQAAPPVPGARRAPQPPPPPTPAQEEARVKQGQSQLDRTASEVLLWWLRNLGSLTPTSHEAWQEREELFAGTMVENLVREMGAAWARNGAELNQSWLEARAQNPDLASEERSLLFKALVGAEGQPTGSVDKILISFKELGNVLRRERVRGEMLRLESELRRNGTDLARSGELLKEAAALKIALEKSK